MKASSKVILVVFAVIASVLVAAPAEAKKRHRHHRVYQPVAVENSVGFGSLFSSAAAAPRGFIRGSLKCATNVNAYLASIGRKGTGSLLAASFLSWGSPSDGGPGSVAVYKRRGGHHAAVVAFIKDGKRYIWNPSQRGQRWALVQENRKAIAYRI